MNSLLGRFFRSDAVNGIEYNHLVPIRRVSRAIYRADIARHPQIIKDRGIACDVMAKVRFINSERNLLDGYSRNIKGRST